MYSVLVCSLIILSIAQVAVTASFPTRASEGNSRTHRIFNADGNATLGDIPYQALVVVDGGFVFGGTLISEEWILTSAECVFGHTTWDVTLGIVNLVDDEPGRVTMESKTAIAHPDFSPSTSNNDIGLIKLPTPVNETINIWRAYLPSPSEEEATFAGEMVIASGFGNTDGGGSISETLRYTNLVVLANSACQSYYDILDIEMCAFGEGTTCPGDNGGPLVLSYPKDGTYKVVGVTSFGPRSGCNVTFPDGFTRVSKYLTWIYNNTGILG